LQERLAEQRQAVRALARLGRDILADEGRPASDAIVDRIAKTLDAAALDEGARFQLRAGRLAEELEPPGFEALAGMTPARPPRRTDAAKPKRGGAAEARRRVEEAKRDVRARTREAIEAERRVERAEATVAEARNEARAARKRADGAERALAEAESALRKARRS
jgi:chromosome segregation ATPase